MELLQRVFNEQLERNANKAPWNYIAAITVEEFAFGLVPPRFQFCCARYDPARQLLSFAMDVTFTTSGAQAVLLLRMKSIGMLQGLSMRLEATHIHIGGRLHLGVQLTHEPPGIKGVYYSFAGEPQLDISARPLGVTRFTSDLPGIVSALRGLLARIIRKRMVEPQRRFFDVQRMYVNRHARRAGGPGGLLRVVLLSGRNVAAPPPVAAMRAAPAATGGGGTEGLATYVTLRFGRQVLRTPLVHHTSEPVWNWSFSLALPADVGSLGPREDAMQLTLCDAKTIGEPAVIGKCNVKISSLGLEPNSNPRPVVLPLAPGPAAPALQLSVQWLKGAPKKPDPFAQAEARAAAFGSKGLEPQAQQRPAPQPPQLQRVSAPATTAAPPPTPFGQAAAAPPALRGGGGAAAAPTPASPTAAASAEAAGAQLQGRPHGPRDSFHRRAGSAGNMQHAASPPPPPQGRASLRSASARQRAPPPVGGSGPPLAAAAAASAGSLESSSNRGSEGDLTEALEAAKKAQQALGRSSGAPTVNGTPEAGTAAPAPDALTHSGRPRSSTSGGLLSAWRAFRASRRLRSASAAALMGPDAAHGWRHWHGSGGGSGSGDAASSQGSGSAALAPQDSELSLVARVDSDGCLHILGPGDHGQAPQAIHSQQQQGGSGAGRGIGAGAGAQELRGMLQQAAGGVAGAEEEEVAGHDAAGSAHSVSEISQDDGSVYSVVVQAPQVAVDSGADQEGDGEAPGGNNRTSDGVGVGGSGGGAHITVGGSAGRHGFGLSERTDQDVTTYLAADGPAGGRRIGAPPGRPPTSPLLLPQASQQPRGAGSPSGSVGSGLSSLGGGGEGGVNPLAVLARVAQLQRQLEEQRRAAEQAQSQLAAVTNRYEQLRRLRRVEGRNALLEGARFLLHGPEGVVRPVLMWLDEANGYLAIAAPPEGRASAWSRAGMLRSRSHTQLGSAAAGAAPAPAGSGGGAGGASSGAAGGPLRAETLAAAWGALCSCGKEELAVLRQLPLAGARISVRPGADLFVRPLEVGSSWAQWRALVLGSSGGGSAVASGGLDGARCFTVVHMPEVAGAVASGYNLQVPPCGNGRRRDEWVSALCDIHDQRQLAAQ